MLFDFREFIADLRNNEEKKEIVEKYEKAFWEIKGDLKEQQWYTEYVGSFEAIKYKTPEDLEKDFDWDLLQILILASFSSDYELKSETGKNEERELFIAVKSGDQSIVKKISELWSYQIQRLYEIYVEEQINLHILKSESEQEKNAIEQERIMRLKRWKAVLDTLDNEELKGKAKEEQESQLGDLMGQL